MTSEAYRKVLQMARDLPVEEQLQLIEDLISRVRYRVQAKPTQHHGIGRSRQRNMGRC